MYNACGCLVDLNNVRSLSRTKKIVTIQSQRPQIGAAPNLQYIIEFYCMLEMVKKKRIIFILTMLFQNLAKKLFSTRVILVVV